MVWYNDNKEFFRKERKYIKENQPELHYKIKDGEMHLIGTFHLYAQYNDIPINEKFKIDIIFPSNYPEFPPVVTEISSKIDSNYHRNKKNNFLCLSTPIEEYNIFRKEPTIKNFIETLLTPYLYRYSYIKKFGKSPWGERAHGAKGLLEYYREIFNTDDDVKILELLDLVYNNKYKGHLECICGSGKKFRNCHGNEVLKLLKIPKKVIEKEINALIMEILENKDKIRKMTYKQKDILKNFIKSLKKRKSN